jgi:L,D-peptidoglycan transpeptidase YkuD (ErfK/YbiS/YcfS/YnhG family)
MQNRTLRRVVTAIKSKSRPLRRSGLLLIALLSLMTAGPSFGLLQSVGGAVRQGIFGHLTKKDTLRRATSCAATIADKIVLPKATEQLIVVESTRYNDTTATFTAWRRAGACWSPRFGPWQGRIGRAGFSDHHREGDGTTPTGEYGIGTVMYGNAPDPGLRYRYHRLVCGDWWDEDPSSLEYNRFQRVPCGTAPPFGGDSEALWRETGAYPVFAVIDYNVTPVIRGAGSAIFIHADVGVPTDGCVSLPPGELYQLLRWLNPKAAPAIVMGPDDEIERF